MCTVAMSLYALIYTDSIKGVNSCYDLVQINEIGNQLYSTLCTGNVQGSRVHVFDANRNVITVSIIVKATLVIACDSNSIIEGYQCTVCLSV